MGFDHAYAMVLATDDRFDLHELQKLIDKGAAPQIAAQIVAPLENK